MSYDYLTFLFFNRKYTAKERLTSTAGTFSVICELFLQKAYMPAEEDDQLKTSLILSWWYSLSQEEERAFEVIECVVTPPEIELSE